MNTGAVPKRVALLAGRASDGPLAGRASDGPDARRRWRVRLTAAPVRLLPALLLCLLPACQQQMAKQPSYRPYEPSKFFDDGRAERPAVPGTVARGRLRIDSHLFDGRRPDSERHPEFAAALVVTSAANPLGAAALAAAESDEADRLSVVDTFPFPVTQQVLEHGRNRFMIYCVVCHDTLGTGRGMIVQRGYTQPPSYHIERLRQAPVGHFFKVITRGYGSMPSYRYQVPPRDRWAIIGYIRALQLSQRFPTKDLTDAMRREYTEQRGNAPEGGPAP